MPTLPADRRRGVVHLLRRADRRRRGSRSRSRRPPPTTAPPSRTTRTLVGLEKDAAGHVHGARVARRRRGDRRSARRTVVNATGVWSDDVRALDEGTHPDVDPPREGHPHHGAVVAGAQRDRRGDPGAEGPALGVRRAVGRRGRRRTASRTSAPPTPTTTARSTIPQMHARRHRVSAARDQRVGHDHDHRSRHPRHVGRPASARARRAANAPPTSRRRHSVRVAPSGVVTVTGGKLTTYRRMAADTVDAVVKVLERGGRSRTKQVRLHGATGWDAPDLPAPFTTRYGADARERARAGARRTRRSASRSFPASPTRAPRSCTRRAPRWRARSTTCSPAAPAPACSRATRRRPPPTTSPRSWPPSSAGTRRAATARSSTYRALDRRRAHDAAGLPETALDALLANPTRA